MKRFRPALALIAPMLVTLGGMSVAHAQFAAPVERPFDIVKSDPSLDALISPGTKLETVGSGF
ncbi:MAG TPA: hypothetical protein VGO53_05705, partial [Steroidobacteraceae bacterium]|nr:hypothetical protein [Steroidobacteraceae bacterium]